MGEKTVQQLINEDSKLEYLPRYKRRWYYVASRSRGSDENKVFWTMPEIDEENFVTHPLLSQIDAFE